MKTLLLLCMLCANPLWAEEAIPRPVVSEIVVSEAARLRDFPGVIEPEVQATLGFLTAGQIAKRPVKLGDRVKMGDVLAVLDQITLSNDREAAEAGARAANARAELARQSFARVEELHRRGVVSVAQLEGVTANRDASSAALKAAEADLVRARDAESYANLTAPSAGVVVAVHAEPGASVVTGTPVVTLAQGTARDAVIDVPSEVLAILPPDARFTVQGRGMTTATETGRLRLIEPVADKASRTHRLRISLDPPKGPADGGLRLGSLVTVSLDLPRLPVLTLPEAAISPEGKVWRVGAGRKLEAVSVQRGVKLGTRIVVTGGISEGDEILIRGIHSVSAGQIVGERVAG